MKSAKLEWVLKNIEKVCVVCVCVCVCVCACLSVCHWRGVHVLISKGKTAKDVLSAGVV